MLAAVARRGALIVFGLVVALLAAELLLQAGAAYRTATGRRAAWTLPAVMKTAQTIATRATKPGAIPLL